MTHDPRPLTILGIDPGYDRIGIGIITHQKSNVKHQVVFCDCIETDKKKTLVERYQQIYDQLEKIIQTYKPDIAAVESLFFFKNKKTAMHVSEARGVILACLFNNNVSIQEFTPLEIKQSITGYGRADKKAVEKMVKMELHLESEKNKKQKKRKGQDTKYSIPNTQYYYDDTLDALATALTCAYTKQW